jgi:hypothetical protein
VPRTLGLLSRTLLGLNGLLTVWCLGCCGLEPLVSAGNGADAAECAQNAPMSSPDVLDCGCSCQSCCAVSTPRFAFHAAASETPELPPGFSDALIGTTQQPRYPPPKVLALRD